MKECWCCGSSSTASSRLSPLPFLACSRCGFAFREDLEDAEVHAVYEGGKYERMRGEEYLRNLDARRRHARVRLAALAPFVRTGRLLDVGAAGGAFVSEAARSGFTAQGVEPTPAFAALARDHLGADVRTGTVEAAAFQDGSFDVVTLWHVLEHIPHPGGELARLRAALRPGGLIGIEVPNAGGVLALRQGTAWASLEPTVHVGQYTPAALRTLLERAGYVDVRVGTTTVWPYLTGLERLKPRELVHRARTSAWLRSPRVEHPTGHELLRAFARAPG
jgi:SAM-dependent methyltransferase